MIRGALLARDRERFLRDKSNYDEVEERALHEEDNPRLLRQPKQLKVVLMACAIGAIVQYGSFFVFFLPMADLLRGWSQENLTGANLSWPDELFNTQNGRIPTWNFGAVNSVSYFSASLLSVPLLYKLLETS